jgi:hypothetical protein
MDQQSTVRSALTDLLKAPNAVPDLALALEEQGLIALL